MTTLTPDVMGDAPRVKVPKTTKWRRMWAPRGSYLRARLYWALRRRRVCLHGHARRVSLRFRVLAARDSHYDSPQP